MFSETIRRQVSEGSPQKILVVDDESGIRDGIKSALEQLGFLVSTAESGEQALYQFRNAHDISFVLSDYKMPGLTGFDLLQEIKKQSPQTKVVLMTGFGSVHHAVNAMQLGADDYLCKPFAVEDLERIILKCRPPSKFESSSQIATSLISEDPAFKALLKKADRAAKSNAPILIEGSSGTGKELLARQIHEWSPRKEKPWVAINCAALPAGLLESELFGFEKGAFTGALEKKHGKFEQANGGTLLLDEIGELDPLLQAKLLRVLQEGEVDRLGGKKSIKIDVRVIATTNRNLEKLVHEDKFREDLFFRLYGVRFILPNLRDRALDIPVLAKEFLRRQSSIQGNELCFAEGVLESLQRMAWPGNVRELERAIERAAVFSDRGIVHLENFEFTAPQAFHPANAKSFHGSHGTPARVFNIDQTSSQRPIREMEREIILSALESHAGNRTHTARALGMSLRTLRHKLKQYREAGLIEGELISNGEEITRQEVGKNIPFFSMDAELTVPTSASWGGPQLAHPKGGEL
ncbi:MAG: Fis family transcriptional regulator [Bacteriovoracaceae bacterium]|nr:Fis family transcriptional regulator [Bacteriovoracaceae bacterium]